MTAVRFDPIFNFDNFAEQFYRPAGSRAPELPCQKESRPVDWAQGWENNRANWDTSSSHLIEPSGQPGSKSGNSIKTIKTDREQSVFTLIGKC